ncbi:MAG TPA: hypothetical protein PK224_03280 [Nitrospira sp.]|nr:hypothetical protein [Nitrospira sp.]
MSKSFGLNQLLIATSLALLTLTIMSPEIFASHEKLVDRHGQPAKPNGACTTPLLASDNWSSTEKSIWAKICIGDDADLGEWNNNEHVDNSFRVVSPRFLETIILHQPYSSAITHYGVTIRGAWFKEIFDLSHAVLANPIRLENCKFESTVIFTNLRSSQLISFEDSKFNDDLDMEQIHTDSTVSLSGSHFSGDVDISNANIRIGLKMVDATFMKPLDMRGIRAGAIIGRNSRYTDIELLGGSKIERNVELDGAEVSGVLDIRALEVNGNIFLRGGGKFNRVIIRSTKVQGGLELDESAYKGHVEMTGLQTNGGVSVTGITGTSMKISNSSIGGDLNLIASSLTSLSLSETSIRGEFVLAGSSFKSALHWNKNGRISMINTDTGAFRIYYPDDNEKAQAVIPSKVGLTGFTYSRISGTANTDIAKGNAPELIGADAMGKWLLGQLPYSRQSYQHLANVLRTSGYVEKANDVLFESRNREYYVAEGLQKVSLWLEWVLIGYGYRIYLSFFWAIGLILVGATILWISRQGVAKQIPFARYPFGYLIYGLDLIFFSFDMLLPIIKLREQHYSIDLVGWVRYYFYFQKVAGWILGSFIVAGLSGLTK